MDTNSAELPRGTKRARDEAEDGNHNAPAPLASEQNHNVSEKAVLVLPHDLKGLVDFLLERKKDIIKIAQALKKPLTVLDPEQTERVEMTLRALRTLPNINPEVEKKCKIESILKVITGEIATNKNSWTFPPPFPTIAAELLEQFEKLNWGADLVQDDSSSEEEEEVHVREKKKKPKKTIPVTKGPMNVKAPPADHPIYGSDGIMRGILHYRDVKVTTALNSLFPGLRNDQCNNFGHNNITIGTWWPRQVCVLRDGAHGSKQGGIAGSKSLGAFSIVVSGMYADLDHDYGDSLYYSGSQSHDNRHPTQPEVSDRTQALQRSIVTSNPVRVIRSHNADKKYAPSVGFRYDGLYRVVKEEKATNKKGGAYLRFLLKRLDGQPPISKTHPTREEILMERKVKDGY